MKIFSTSELRDLNMSDLKKHFLEVRSKIIIGKNKNHDTTDLETYICYITKDIYERISAN